MMVKWFGGERHPSLRANYLPPRNFKNVTTRRTRRGVSLLCGDDLLML